MGILPVGPWSSTLVVLGLPAVMSIVRKVHAAKKLRHIAGGPAVQRVIDAIASLAQDGGCGGGQGAVLLGNVCQSEELSLPRIRCQVSGL